MMKQIGQILIALAIAVLAGVGVMAVGKYGSLKTREMELAARHECASDYRQEYTDAATNTVVKTPIEELYQKCLEEKSIK